MCDPFRVPLSPSVDKVSSPHLSETGGSNLGESMKSGSKIYVAVTCRMQVKGHVSGRDRTGDLARVRRT